MYNKRANFDKCPQFLIKDSQWFIRIDSDKGKIYMRYALYNLYELHI